ncbi:hypothetical protein BLS_001612 [Venturia inaequalis]|uniref:Uncharacterized protein n=1 Tax=Venturia inaequalis TaxID=5025 RepID=A0A8H3UHW1_VENIN|nr:hypothetical protein EG328_006640 [Venturia inaequalis]KAE9977154.1 hypothetical protein BLS_001612 [Venturia inaequalis]KAE9994681.1 hypothetical protein EG327_005127 [Venturia inaequalis]RDI79921.1 hypothetical protein Vi05172_g9968 [Venturia inaequalis]
MLSSLFLSAYVALSAILANATPVSVDIPMSMAERNAPHDTGVYICRDVDWQACEHVLSKWGNSTSDTYCLQLDGESSAVGPDPGLECVLYSSIDCKGTDSLKLRYPGYSWLGSVNWNDNAKSYQCYWVDRSLAVGTETSSSTTSGDVATPAVGAASYGGT